MYSELKEQLKNVRKKKGLSNYQRWNESKAVIDAWYGECSLDESKLYDRMILLKRKEKEFKNVIISSVISVLCGVVASVELARIGEFLEMKQDFLLETQAIMENALVSMNEAEAQSAMNFYDTVIGDTLLQFNIVFILGILCLIMIVILVIEVLRMCYRIRDDKFDLYDYEIAKIESILQEKEAAKMIENKSVDKE